MNQVYQKSTLIAVALLLALSGGYLLADYYSGVPADAAADFVGRESCADCHQPEVELFHGSHHDLAMDLATDETVLADFNDQTLAHFGVTSRMFRKGQKFMVQTEGPDGRLHDYQVKYVFGVEPLQQYMVEIEPSPAGASEIAVGRTQVLRLSWDVAAKRWFYLQPPDVATKLEPDDPLHWTGVTQNWNVSCAVCHSTNLQKGFDVHRNRFATTFSEIDVSCEACHGPGGLHVQIAKTKGVFWDRRHGLGLAKLKTTSNLPQVETCAPCHSRRTVLAEGFQTGCRYDDYYALQAIQTPIYHADGQIRDEDYVYGSFLQSKMFHRGIRCSDCHDPHSARLKHDGNQVCTSCHQHSAGKYDSPSHHFHAVGSAGAQCINCHMPHTTYMAVDQRHDHSFRVPRPDLSLKLGTPNACTACHLIDAKLPPDPQRRPLKQYLDWIIVSEQGDEAVRAALRQVDETMQSAVQKWHPALTSPPKTQYYEDLATALADVGKDDEKVAAIKRITDDHTVPDFVRASVLLQRASRHVGASDPLPTAEDLATLGDAPPQVAAAELRLLGAQLPDLLSQLNDSKEQAAVTNAMAAILDRVTSLLDHDSRQVRIEAFRVAFALPPELRELHASVDQRKAFNGAKREYEAFLKLNQDRAGGQLVLGQFYEQLGRVADAQTAYGRAMEMDNALAGPRSQLASLLERQAAQGGSTSLELLSRAKRLRTEEHVLLRRDLKLSEHVVGNHTLHYRFAMSCLLQRDYAKAATHLEECLRQQPQNESYLYTAAAFYLQTGNLSRAKEIVTRLLKVNSSNPAYRQLADEVETQ